MHQAIEALALSDTSDSTQSGYAFLQQLFAVITRKEMGDITDNPALGAGLCAVQPDSPK